jgi:hypothetical protein
MGSGAPPAHADAGDHHVLPKVVVDWGLGLAAVSQRCRFRTRSSCGAVPHKRAISFGQPSVRSTGRFLQKQMREQIVVLAAQWQVDLVIVEGYRQWHGLIQRELRSA